MIFFISGPEILFVGLIVLLVFGADKIPEISRGLGKGIRQVKDATGALRLVGVRLGFTAMNARTAVGAG